MKMKRIAAAMALTAGSMFPATAGAQLLDREFTYQGLLTQSGSRVDGTADFMFYLYDAAAGGNLIAGPIAVDNVSVDGGIFTATLDFGSEAFNGSERWLRTDVRSPAGSGSHTTLSPRQNVRSAPYALQMRGIFVDDNRLVGINQANPTDRLHVNGSIRADGPSYDTLLNVNSPNSLITYDADGDRSTYVSHSDLTDGGQFILDDEFGQIVGLGASDLDGSGILSLRDYEFRADTLSLWADADLDNSNGSASGLIRVGASGAASGGQIEITSPSGDRLMNFEGSETGGRLDLNNEFGGRAIALGNDPLRGGVITTYTENVRTLATIQPDFDGEGAFMRLYRHDGAWGLQYDGNFLGTENPHFQITGSSQSAVFDMSSAGNDAVQLPVDAINSGEIQNESGVASEAEGVSSTGLTGFFPSNILSRTIVCPSAGYVLAIGTVQFTIDHTLGTSDFVLLGVSDTFAAHPSNQDVALYIPADVPTGPWRFPVTVQGVFEVAAGNNTFYLVGHRQDGDPEILAFDKQLSLVFIPSAYGAVTPPLEPDRVPESTQASHGGRTAGEIEAERTEAMLLAEARRDAEMQAMRDEIEALRRLVEADMARTGQGDVPVAKERVTRNPVQGTLGDSR